MQVGQQVVCVDDHFPGPLARYYTQLPEKGKTYTIRAVYVARQIMHPSAPGAADGELGLLLKELQNPPDPRHRGHNELGFKAERFRTLDELKTDEAETQEQEDLVGLPSTPGQLGKFEKFTFPGFDNWPVLPPIQ